MGIRALKGLAPEWISPPLQIASGRVRELAHAQIVDDQQRDVRDGGDVLLAGAAQLRLGELLEQDLAFEITNSKAQAWATRLPVISSPDGSISRLESGNAS